MSEINSNYNSGYDGYDDYETHADETEGLEEYTDGIEGDVGLEGEGREEAASSKERLKSLQNSLRKSKEIDPGQRKEELKELGQLDRLLKEMGDGKDPLEQRLASLFEEKLSALENEVADSVVNAGTFKDKKAILTAIETEMNQNTEITEKEKVEFKKLLKEVRENLAEDPTLNVEEALQPIRERLDAIKLYENTMKTEETRSAGIGAEIASKLNQLFLQKNGEDGYSWGDFENDVYTTVGVVGQIGTLGLPVGKWLTQGVGGLLGFETQGPSFGLKHLDNAARNLDMVLHHQSGLENTSIPGDVATTLYDTNLSAAEKINKIQGLISSLPSASQAYVLSTVIRTVGSADPQKLQFLKENEPEVLESLSKIISQGQDDIKNGALANTGDKFDVVATAGGYKIQNNDTKWYRNDWNDFTIPQSEITEPMTQALRVIEGIQVSPEAAEATE